MKKNTIILVLLIALLFVGTVGAIMVSVGPGTITVNFTANKTTANPGTPIQFTDTTTPSANSWGWFFGDETYGATWTLQSSSPGWNGGDSNGRIGLICVPMYDNSTILIGGAHSQTSTIFTDAWRSIDGGITWVQQSSGQWNPERQLFTATACPDGSIVLMGGLNWGGDILYNDVWRSTDLGVNWNRMTPGAEWAIRLSPLVVALSDGTLVLLGGYNYSGSYDHSDVWTSNNNGANWTQVKNDDATYWSGRHDFAAVVLPGDVIVIMGGNTQSGNVNDVWKSSNKGVTWTKVKNNDGNYWSKRRMLKAVAMADGSILLMGGFGLDTTNDVWRSVDQGATWTQLPNANWPKRSEFGCVATNDGIVMVMGGGKGNSLYATTYITKDAGSGGSSSQNPTHTYSAIGTYTVSLTASNSTASDTKTKVGYITITNTPIATKSTGNPTISMYPMRQGIGIPVNGGVIPWGP